MKMQRKKTEVSIPVMAMGDIAFLLLIFFVILAKATDDSHVKWEPAESADLDSTTYSPASVAIDNENRTWLNGKEIGHAQLADAVKDIISSVPDPKQRVVLLKVHREATATYFEPVIEAVSEAGGKLVHVLEREQAGKQ